MKCFVKWICIVSGLAFSSGGFADEPTINHRYADINGIRMHYATAGDGKLILFLHGFPEFWYQWRSQLTDFGRDYLAVAPDLRGINLTTRPADVAQYRVKTLVEDVRALADHLGPRKFVLVGHDWGGLIAWAFALYYPERLEKLVILNAPHPLIFEREFKENPAQQLASQYMLMFNTPQAEAWLAEKDYAQLTYLVLGEGLDKGYVTEEDKAEYLALWRDGGSITGGLNYYRAARIGPAPKPGEYWSARKHFAPDIKLWEVRVPTLVIWGVMDPFLPAGNLSGLNKYVPNLTVKLFPTDGHWLNRAKAQEVNTAIREFIAK
jgi:pimeloyl-ACP methyl ester carboxylesterase